MLQTDWTLLQAKRRLVWSPMRTHYSHLRGNTNSAVGYAFFTAIRLCVLLTTLTQEATLLSAVGLLSSLLLGTFATTRRPLRIHYFSQFLSVPQDLLSTADWTGVGSTNLLISIEGHQCPKKRHLFLCFRFCYNINCLSDQFQYNFWSLLAFLYPPYTGYASRTPHYNSMWLTRSAH